MSAKKGRPRNEVPNDPVIGDRIKAARKSNGIKTQNDLVDKIQELTGETISVDSVKNWERHKIIPSHRNFRLLSIALNKPISWFMNEDGKEQEIIDRNTAILEAAGPAYLKQLALDNLARALGYPGNHLQRLQLSNLLIYSYLERCLDQAITLFDKEQQEFIELSLRYALENFKYLHGDQL